MFVAACRLVPRAVAVLPGALGFTGRFNLVSVAVAFVVGWLSASLLVGVLYRAFSPRWPRPSPGRGQ